MSLSSDIDFKYEVGLHGINPPFPNRTVVQESSGKIWIGTPSGNVGIDISYSVDNGITWVSSNYIDNNNNHDGRAWTGLFLDANENLIFGYTTGTLGNNFRMIKKNRLDGTTTVYNQSIQGGTGPSLGGFAPLVNACQDDIGNIHILRSVITNFTFGANQTEGAYNLYYFNFKDGVFSSDEQLTNYSGYSVTDYQYTVDPIDIYGGGEGVHFNFPHIIFHNSQLLILWQTRKYISTGSDGDGHSIGTTTRQTLYAIKSNYMDLISASHPWTTGRAYKVGYGVVELGSYYVCNTDHTSIVFTTDIAKWTLINAGSITTPTIFYSSVILNNLPYQTSSATLFGIQAIRSNGILYFIHIVNINAGDPITYYLYQNFVDITPHGNDEWGDWMWPDHIDVAMNDDLMLFGYDKRIFGDRASAVARIKGEWLQEHTDTKNAFYAGTTYNFARIR